MNCIFCEMKDYILENELAYAIYDKYPVGKGHMLFIPKHSPDSYNVGINCGEHAGQTIMHVHVHLIPRYIGDMKDPTGGVRGVIPEKMKY